MKKTILTVTVMAAIITGCSKHNIKYPAAPTSDTVDNYFGIEVVDSFRPLENDTAANTLAWVEAERQLTEDYLSQIPFRDALRDRLTKLMNYKRSGMPSKENDGKYYYSENNGLQNQSVIYRATEVNGEPEVFLDPNKLSDDGTVALGGTSMSPDGKYTAYCISRSGSDWTEIYVMDTETKELLPDHIEWAKFTGAEWDGEGFYYSAYSRPEAGKEFSNANENHRVYYHKLGTPQSDDVLVYEDAAHPLHFHTASVPDDKGEYLAIYGSGAGLGNSVDIRKKGASKWTTMVADQKYDNSILDVADGKIYIYTNYGAPRYRIMTAPVNAPQLENWQEFVPEEEGVLKNVQFAKDKLLLTYEVDAQNKVYVHDRDGKRISELQLPGVGTVSLSSSKKNDDVFYTFTSFTTPSSVYSYNLADGTSQLLKAPEIDGFNPDDYVTEQVFYTSADGTKIPMFLTYKKGLERNGKNPVYLYGYGGFNISLKPGFSAQRLLWLENGGIYAQPSLRGGGEYGEEWHVAGTKQEKMNVFNDFIGAAEYLINEGWTSPEYLSIHGGSNGGLLVGATVNLRPDLFKVAVPAVGVMDMMRYHLFTIGWNWASDYGTSADSKEMAEYLLSYSPVHTIKNDGTPYPAILVTTADHDDRVVPAHSFKYAATLQASDTGDAPKLIRIDSKAGHGSGKPISKVIDEYADVYSFVFYNLGITPVEK